ncbi:MAG: efflux RND transporter periplasmic adaptor subunit [Bdellovibrionales bacterium]|nr:efflux RND transporter periplasmic adaptor subunit [Bdellovibrionales bacterium]
MKVLPTVIDWTVKAVCAAVLVYFAVVRGPEPVELVKATRGLFESRVHGEGIIQSKTRYTVAAFAEGSAKKPNFGVGDEIRQGAVVTEILIGPNFENLRAAVTGVVSKVFHHAMGKVERKEPIIEISDPEHMEMLTDLIPSDAEQVHLNDSFTITKWGGPEPLKGVITHIGKPDPEKEGKVPIAGVLQDVPSDIFKKLGERTELAISIQVAKFPDALKIPIGAAFRNKKNWTVFRVVDRHAREKNVTILNRNNEEVMIGNGLTEGDAVIDRPGALVKDGIRVVEVPAGSSGS